MKLSIFISLFLLFRCSSEIYSEKTAIDYTNEIQKIKTFVKANGYNQKIAFMVDYSLHSGLSRFFVVDLNKEKILDKGLVCHGSCKGENDSDYAEKFSNINDSYCTSLGFASIGKRDYSKWGKHYKYWINGLEISNSNMKSRVVVLHAWEGVANKTIYPISLATSWGCPTVSINFLDRLDKILKKEEKIVIYSFE